MMLDNIQKAHFMCRVEVGKPKNSPLLHQLNEFIVSDGVYCHNNPLCCCFVRLSPLFTLHASVGVISCTHFHIKAT